MSFFSRQKTSYDMVSKSLFLVLLRYQALAEFLILGQKLGRNEWGSPAAWPSDLCGELTLFVRSEPYSIVTTFLKKTNIMRGKYYLAFSEVKRVSLEKLYCDVNPHECL